MIQGYNPRTGQPTGEPVAETTDADVDAAVRRGGRGLAGLGVPWTTRPGPTRWRPLADALDERAAELVALADAETALGETRLTGEVGRTTGQLRLFAGVLRDGGYPMSRTLRPAGGIGRNRPHQSRDRPGRRVRRVQLPVRVLGPGAGHRVGAGRRLPGGGQGARGPPEHLRR